MTISLADVARSYLDAGLCVLPAIKAQKRPAIGQWKDFQQRLPTEAEIGNWRWNDGLCLIAGKVSGNLELIDFDHGGEMFDPWKARIASAELLGKLVIEYSQSGGVHVIYRFESEVQGNVKLAQGQRDGKLQALIETRGEGGLFLCHPTPGYGLTQGDFCNLPVLTTEEREELIAAAYSLNEVTPQPQPAKAFVRGSDVRPGDDYNERGDFIWTLEEYGWTSRQTGGDGNQHWCRPGKSNATSATLKDRIFYCFSSNATPFEPGTAYQPFSVYALLKHGGDFAAAAAELKRQGYGEQTSLFGGHAVEPAELGPPDPGPFPEELLDVPGFVGDVVKWNLDCAKRKQPVLALAGALSLLSLLTGRKVCDSWGTRTNLYCLGVCGASRGKDQARKCNKSILLQAGLEKSEREGMASATGLVNAIDMRPATLFQLDEIGRMLQTLGDGAKQPHLYNIVTVLMRLYTSADSHYVTDVYADVEKAKIIDQPHCVLYGTTVPKSLYEGLTPESISDGFMSRILIFEGASDARMCKPAASDASPPAEIVEAAKWWADFKPGGNLGDQHPSPLCVEYTPEAAEIMEGFVIKADDALMVSSNGTAELWGRAIEKAHKLALLYSCSLDRMSPQITQEAAQWAIGLTEYLTARMRYLASQWVSETPYEKRRKRLLREIHEAGDRGLSQSQITMKLKHLPVKERSELLLDLQQAGAIVARESVTKGRPRTDYVSATLA